MSTERDTHFAGFAKLLSEDLYDMFSNLFIEEADMGPREQEAERTRQHIQSYISERAYDLTIYTLQMVPHLMNVVPNAQTLPEVIEFLPDMTAWPEQGKE